MTNFKRTNTSETELFSKITSIRSYVSEKTFPRKAFLEIAKRITLPYKETILYDMEAVGLVQKTLYGHYVFVKTITAELISEVLYKSRNRTVIRKSIKEIQVIERTSPRTCTMLVVTEENAVKFLKSLGTYKIMKHVVTEKWQEL